MLTREQFEKEIVRMWDSMRDSKYSGRTYCDGVQCSECPLNKICRDNSSRLYTSRLYNAFSIVEAVEQWSKEHPFKTNGQVFEEFVKEKFNVDVNVDGCIGFGSIFGNINLCNTTNCSSRPHKRFWEQEYKGGE